MLSFLEAYAQLALARILLAVPGSRLIRAVQLVHDHEKPVDRSTPVNTIRFDALALAVARAARRHPGRSTCLARSLALRQMLLARGYPARICLGVRRPADPTELAAEPAWQRAGVMAHAWVEVDGVVVGDDPAVKAAFKPLERPGNVAWD